MSKPHPTRVVYATSSKFKREEIKHLPKLMMKDGEPLGDRVAWDVRNVDLKETLEADLVTMVQAEARDAYKRLLVPCIVEHAGLVFDKYKAQGYPGGLTKPMWNTLRDQFVPETQMDEQGATARAVVGYCDGKTVRTFVGETHGHLVGEPRGDRDFYWDTVFVPDDENGDRGEMTYAEIVADPSLGLEHKVVELSQSGRAMREFLEFRLVHGPALWPGV